MTLPRVGRAASVLLAVYAVVWIGLEGRLWQAVSLAAGIAMLTAAQLWFRWRDAGTRGIRRYGLGALLGAYVGAGTGFYTLLLMTLKTGLHAHGPEFTPAEIAWVLGRSPLWLGAGVLAGLGVAMLAAGRRPRA